MNGKVRSSTGKVCFWAAFLFLLLSVQGYEGFIGYGPTAGYAQVLSAPSPLVQKSQPVDWWFVFKFNAASFPGCGQDAHRGCLFGTTLQSYQGRFSQQFEVAEGT